MDYKDIAVNRTVAFIARCTGYITGKRDIAFVKLDGNQIHVTFVKISHLKKANKTNHSLNTIHHFYI